MKKSIALLLVAALALIGAGCAAKSAAQPPQTPAPVQSTPEPTPTQSPEAAVIPMEPAEITGGCATQPVESYKMLTVYVKEVAEDGLSLTGKVNALNDPDFENGEEVLVRFDPETFLDQEFLRDYQDSFVDSVRTVLYSTYENTEPKTVDATEFWVSGG